MRALVLALMTRGSIALLALVALLGVWPRPVDSGTATANLAVQIVANTNVSAQCPATAPPQAAAAGMTTQAFCNDFTMPIPNTAGTGLPATWLGCANPGGYGTADSNPHVWYEPTADIGFDPPCNGTSPQSYIRQVTDPVYGNLVMDFAAGTNRENGYYDNVMTMSTHVFDPTNSSFWPLFLDFPMSALTEIVWRSNTNHQNATQGNEPVVDFWSWTAAWYTENISSGYCTGSGHPSCSPLEIDFIEDFGDGLDIGAFHNWNDQTAGGITGGPPSSFYDPNAYTKLDVLITSDGVSNIKGCAWVGPEAGPLVFKGCNDYPGRVDPVGTRRDGSGGYDTRNVLVLWYGGWSGPSSAQAEVPLHFYVKKFARWECADWQRGTTGPNPNCFGGAGLTTGSDGSLYHQVTVQ
jgi:hypothetical protein